MRSAVEFAGAVDVDRPADFGRQALEAIAAFRGGRPARDDQTMVVLHHNTADPPSIKLGQKLKVMAARIRSIGIHPGGST